MKPITLIEEIPFFIIVVKCYFIRFIILAKLLEKNKSMNEINKQII